MAARKTLTAVLTAAALVAGISLAWAQTGDQAAQPEATSPVAAGPSEQTPADPSAVPLTDSLAPMPQQSSGVTSTAEPAPRADRN